MEQTGAAPSAGNVVAVTVTYGDRAGMLTRVVDAVLAMGLTGLIIVDNASCSSSARRIRAVRDQDPDRVQLIRLEKNLGSAGGFCQGLEAAWHVAGAEYVWLLDDDNKPNPDALDSLSLAYRLLGTCQDNALVSLRRSRKEYLEAATRGRKVGIVPNSFLGFHIREWGLRRIRLRSGHDGKAYQRVRYPLVAVGYAPYGGLFFHKSWLQRIGLPDSRFFLYEDDHEYTIRLQRAGGYIYLCAASELTELEPSWGEVSGAAPALVSQRSESTKVYHLVRNRTAIESAFVTSPLIYSINMVLFLGVVFVKGLAKEHHPAHLFRRARLIMSAFSAGRKKDFLKGERQ